MRVPLEPHHVEAITAMDRVWMEQAYAKGAGGKPTSPLTAAAFDAFMR
ncbi:hypothetical protein Salmuc_02769 [Salipiger mucosus DSM 16094]|uniref:Uncharacterized protein n=2 Tax=Salipiger mucosus TaxID=263378 RepID=S9SGG7_9RHOB|nr:hypothetical protein Salmuc_02769 [Salipiger mucosus DSM 16094]